MDGIKCKKILNISRFHRMKRWLCVSGTIMVRFVLFFLVVENKWFTEYQQTRNRALVFHTKQGIIVHRKGRRGVIKCQFLRNVDHE